MTAVNNDALVALHGDSLANFGTTYAAMQETMKSQANSLVAMQNQLANIQQFCMTIDQQPSSISYALAQQKCTFTNHKKRNSGGQSNGRGFPQQPTTSFAGTGGSQQQVIHRPTPYKCWENWNYCHSHGGDIEDNHTSLRCGKPGPMHNPNASLTNIMGRLVSGMHKTILPSACGRTPPNCCPVVAALSAMSAHCLLPTWRHALAATNPSRAVWRNATGQRHLSPADDHGHAGVSARPRNDDECWTVPSERQKCANDADGPTADRGTHVDKPLCSQPAAQPAAGVLLTSRGGQQ
jgi:hypothetical protein